MGNAPLPSPPPPNDHRFILYISTKFKIVGTKLYIIRQSHNNSNNVTTDDQEDHDELPIPLRDQFITKEEYDLKLLQLEKLLSEWKAGRLHLILMIWSFTVFCLFVAAYFTPSFWESRFVDHPFWLVGIMFIQFAVFYVLFSKMKRSTCELLTQVDDLYNEWKSTKGIYVKMKQVANLGRRQQAVTTTTTTSDDTRWRQENFSDYSGQYCFCVVFNVGNDPQLEEGNNNRNNNDDGMSVATEDIQSDIDDDEE